MEDLHGALETPLLYFGRIVKWWKTLRRLACPRYHTSHLRKTHTSLPMCFIDLAQRLYLIFFILVKSIFNLLIISYFLILKFSNILCKALQSIQLIPTYLYFVKLVQSLLNVQGKLSTRKLFLSKYSCQHPCCKVHHLRSDRPYHIQLWYRHKYIDSKTYLSIVYRIKLNKNQIIETYNLNKKNTSFIS